MARIFEYEFTHPVEEKLRTLPACRIKRFYEDLQELIRNPLPDGKATRWIDAPPATAKHRQVARARLAGFLVDYRFRSGRILITRIIEPAR